MSSLFLPMGSDTSGVTIVHTTFQNNMVRSGCRRDSCSASACADVAVFCHSGTQTDDSTMAVSQSNGLDISISC